MKNLYELTPRYDSSQSFYKKAFVSIGEGKKSLWSYGTLVAEVDTEEGRATVFDTYSSTTLRHIKEFLKQEGFKADTKAQIEKDYY